MSDLHAQYQTLCAHEADAQHEALQLSQLVREKLEIDAEGTVFSMPDRAQLDEEQAAWQRAAEARETRRLFAARLFGVRIAGSDRPIGPRQVVTGREIAEALEEQIKLMPGLKGTRVTVLRLDAPDETGCNWKVRHSDLPETVGMDGAVMMYALIEKARAEFNLSRAHQDE